MFNYWHRLEFEDVPIYVKPEGPDWFVPNEAADTLLRRFFEEGRTGDDPALRRLLQRIDLNGKNEYEGRGKRLCLGDLRECWLHLTNRCNLGCAHCMFSSSPAARQELTREEVFSCIDEALRLGCRIFYFTGGEPFIHPDFIPAVTRVLNSCDAHVVILTNLTLLQTVEAELSGLSRDRIHFQISVDGMEENHDRMRGKGSFERLKVNLGHLRKLGFASTAAMAVTPENVMDMSEMPSFAADHGIRNVHFLWLFRKGLAGGSRIASPDLIFPNMIKAFVQARRREITIDNVELFRSQVFSFPGTKFDLSNSGWQALAVGPDGHIYPTPAFVYTEEMRCGHLEEGLEKVWRQSAVLKSVRNASLNDSPEVNQNPLKFLIGGPDIDHSYISCGKIVGGDPYVELYGNIVKWLIAEESRRYATNGIPSFRLKMGERLGECLPQGNGVFFTHSNCVLSLPGENAHTLVNAFYTEAALHRNEDIVNPVCYSPDVIDHIPEKYRFRGYGCGSPVEQAEVREGESLVDLGSGAGIECFIASRMTGPKGLVRGIDMGEAMLHIATQAKGEVARNLGYSNIVFKKAFLESLPFENESADVVISNCVINLSPDKRKVFSEIMRILKPGGRLVISDITYDGEIPLDLKYSERLRGECIGGALGYRDLFGLLDDLGFADAGIVSSYLYRTVKGHDFYSITYRAFKPGVGKQFSVTERPLFSDVIKATSTAGTCACRAVPPPEGEKSRSPLSFMKLGGGQKAEATPKHASGCMVCGTVLKYSETGITQACFYCGTEKKTEAVCENGHFVCDKCHKGSTIDIIKHVCLSTRETDMISLLKKIRSGSFFPLHGPEHHCLMPGIILSAFRNAGGVLKDEQIVTGIERGASVRGGSCGFMGACGAAVGVGIAFSVILEANPLTAGKRQTTMKVTAKVLDRIAGYEAARCCQRECWIALKEASRLSETLLGIRLKADEELVCRQFGKNKECISTKCPLWPAQNNR